MSRSAAIAFCAVLAVWLLSGQGSATAAPLGPWHPEVPEHLHAALPADSALDAKRFAEAGD